MLMFCDVVMWRLGKLVTSPLCDVRVMLHHCCCDVNVMLRGARLADTQATARLAFEDVLADAIKLITAAMSYAYKGTRSTAISKMRLRVPRKWLV